MFQKVSLAGTYDSLTMAQTDEAASITVRVPADAQLWFNGTPTKAAGRIREFRSPPLPAGTYIYHVQARWSENGEKVTETRQVEVTPGANVEVDFPA